MSEVELSTSIWKYLKDRRSIGLSEKELGQIINMVRENDATECPICHGDKRVAVIAQAMGHRPDVAFLRVADERAKTVEACLAAIRKTHEECGGLSLHYAEQAIKGVDK